MCHNCGETHSFADFLKIVNPSLYEQYVVEAFQDRRDIVQHIKPEKKELGIDELLSLPRISLLDDDHQAVKYLLGRDIPRKHLSSLYYTGDFYAYCKKFFPEDETRGAPLPAIIIPLISMQNKLMGFQGRFFSEKFRYLTRIFSPSNPKIFGTNNVNFNKRNFCFEGAFDSLFIPNSMAVLGVAIDSQLLSSGYPTQLTVIVYDNEPRNKDVCNSIKKAIRNGYKVVIWPDSIKEKDINDMISSRLDQYTFKEANQLIIDILNENVYEDMQAELMFNRWKK